MRSALKYVIGGAVGAAIPAVLIAGEAFADTGDDALAAVQQLGIATNLLWIVIGAVLVIFMQAGLRARRDRLLPGEARGARGEHELRHLRPRLRRLLLRRLLAHVRRLSATALLGFDTPIGDSAAIGSGNWVFLWKGGFGVGRQRRRQAGRCLGVLPLHGRVHGHHRHDPDRGHGRAVEVEGVRRLGPVLRRDLLPAVRRLDLGRRLAGQARQQHATLGFGYVDFAGSGVVHAMGGAAALAGASCSGPASASTARTASPDTLPGHHIPMAMLGTFILLFGWFGFNAASTLAATDIQFAVVAANTAIAGAFGATASMFY